MVKRNLRLPGLPAGHIRTNKGIYLPSGGARPFGVQAAASSKTSDTTTSSTLSVTVPSDIASGDLLWMIVAYSSNASKTFSATGWSHPTGHDSYSSNVGIGSGYYVLSKTADGTETDFTLTASGACQINAHLLVIPQADTSSPVDVFSETSFAATTYDSVAVNALTITNDNRLVVGLGVAVLRGFETGAAEFDAGPPTQYADQTNLTGGDFQQDLRSVVAWIVQGTATSTTFETWPRSGANEQVMVTRYTVALKAAP